jgi:hypothetical protein
MGEIADVTKKFRVAWIDGDSYSSAEGSIADSLTDQVISLSGVTRFTGLEIINDNSNDDLTVKLNGTGNASFTVKGGESKSINNFPITAVYLSNSSGSTINYRILVFGV